MDQKTFERAKEILAKIAELEKKGEKIPDVKAVKITVSYNGISFVDISSVLDVDTVDEIKSGISDSCNKANQGIADTISNLYKEFFQL
jgi:hypothetical protein